MIPYHTIPLSSLRMSTVDLGDSLLNLMTIEHDFRWLIQRPGHQSLWSPPIFYPQPNAAAYTDLLLSFLPWYAPFRVIGLTPQTAYQMWILCVTATNFLAAYWFLRVPARRSVPACGIGAFLFAAGACRVALTATPQLLPGFYIIAAVTGIWLIVSRDPETISGLRVHAGFALFVLGLLGQVYGAFYNALFLVLCLVLAVPAALTIPGFSRQLLVLGRRFWIGAGVWAGVALVLVIPAAGHYYLTFQQIGPRPYELVKTFLPPWWAWGYTGVSHWLYGGLYRAVGLDGTADAMRLGFGFVTPLLVAMGFAARWKSPLARIFGLTALAAVIVTLLWPGGFSFWFYVYRWLPGAQGIRAVGRISAFLLLPFSVGLALCIDWFAERRRPVLAIAAILAVLLEQPVFPQLAYKNWGRDQAVAEIQHKLSPACTSYLYSEGISESTAPPAHVQTVAMWGTMETGLPAINGYSGAEPPAYPLTQTSFGKRADFLRLFDGVHSWITRNPGALDHVCWAYHYSPEAAQLPAAPDQAAWERSRTYVQVLGRLPTREELATPVGGDLVVSLMATNEFYERERFVVEQYRVSLGRAPSFTEWQEAVDGLQFGGMTPEDLRKRLGGADAEPDLRHPASAETAALLRQFCLERR